MASKIWLRLVSVLAITSMFAAPYLGTAVNLQAPAYTVGDGPAFGDQDAPLVKPPLSLEQLTGPKQPSAPFVSEAFVAASYDGDLRDLPVDTGAGLVIANGEIILPEPQGEEALAGSKAYVAQAAFADPGVQRAQGGGPMPTPMITFDGMSNQDNFALLGGRVNPPDTNGDVGPNHYIQTVNLVFGIFNKTTGARLLGPTRLTTLFAAANNGAGTGTACDTTNNGDPVTNYDAMADRWVLSQFGFVSSGASPFYQCFLVSKGPNPLTDGWWAYAIRIDGSFPDYPKVSVWPDGYYFTARMFPVENPVFYQATFALERSAMLAGRPARYIKFDMPGTYDSMLASNVVGGDMPPLGTPNIVAVSDDVDDDIVFWRVQVDWATPANSTMSNEIHVDVNPFQEACSTRDCVPFLNSTPTTMLDALSERVMFNLQYRKIGSVESLWANQTITESGKTAVRWYEFRLDRVGNVVTPTVYQQSTYNPADGVWRWMGSINADSQGNAALGYSASSPTIDPQIRYAGRLVTDPVGVLNQSEYTMTVGTGHPTTTNSRWGDYSSMSVDPVDDCTFWYTQEYYTTTTGIPGDNRPWTTRVGAFKYPSCTPLPATGWITGEVRDASSLALLPYIPLWATNGVTRTYAGSTNASGVFTLTTLPGTYSVTAGPVAYIGYPTAGSVSNVVVTSATATGVTINLNGAPYLTQASRSYNDTAQGNGNTYPEPGEKNIAVTLALSNTGVTTASILSGVVEGGITSQLSSMTPGFNVITGTASYPSIPAGGTGSNLTPFYITIDGGVACGATGNFQQVVVASQGTYTIPFTLRVGIPTTYTCTYPVPNLVVGSRTTTDPNANGYLEPGESNVFLDVALNNTGLTNIGPATNVSANLSSATAGLTVTANASAYPNIAANGTATNTSPYTFDISSALVCGAALDFNLAAQSNEGTYLRNFRLVTGQPAPAPATVFVDDVEAGAGTWMTSTNIGTGFVISTEGAHSPSNAWNDSPGVAYANGIDTSITSPSYDFTAYDVVTATFWVSYSTEAGFDYLTVETSNDGGATWNVEIAYDGASGGWVQEQVALGGAVHQGDVQIRFRLTADTGVIDAGVWLDDIAFSGAYRICNPPELSTVSGLNITLFPNTQGFYLFDIENVGYSDLLWNIDEVGSTFAPGGPQPTMAFDSETVKRVSQLQAKAAALNLAPAANVVMDGSFEAGTPSPYWTEYSLLFGTPLCNLGCGVPSNTGDWFIWFGGAGSGNAESGFVTQTVTIPSGNADLYFYLRLSASVNGMGYFTATVDNVPVFMADHTMTATYSGGYHLVVVDVSAFADGGPHELGLYEDDPAGAPTLSNFSAFVDDVAIIATPSCNASDLPWLSVSPASGNTGMGASTSVTATFDATGLTPADYTGNLCVASNDPYAPVTNIPVTLTVAGPAAILLNASPTSTYVNSYSTISLTVLNANNAPRANQPVQLSDNVFHAGLAGVFEVPPNGSAGTGLVSFTYDPDTMQLMYAGAVMSLTGNATAAHIHRAAIGVNGGVLTALTYVTNTNGAVFSGTTTLSAADEALLYAGGLYVNVHTSANPGGEVRGQILDGQFTAILPDPFAPFTGLQSGAGSGVLYFTLNGDGSASYTGWVTGLSSDVNNAHIHEGATNGVVVGLAYINTGGGSASFAGTLTQAEMLSVIAAYPTNLYVNVHTVNNSGGEINGGLYPGTWVITDNNGWASMPYTSATAGTYRISALAGVIANWVDVTFVNYMLFLPLISR